MPDPIKTINEAKRAAADVEKTLRGPWVPGKVTLVFAMAVSIFVGWLIG